MSDETDSKLTLQPVINAHDQNDDLAGASVLTLLQRSGYMAKGNSQYAVDIAKDLSRAKHESFPYRGDAGQQAREEKRSG
jgi:hypothetical protein